AVVRVTRRMTLLEAATKADELAEAGAERELATLRQQWDDEVESAARSADYRQRAVAYRAIGQFRFRQKLELLRRGPEDESPAARGCAPMSLELRARRGHPAPANGGRSLPPRLLTADGHPAVPRATGVTVNDRPAP